MFEYRCENISVPVIGCKILQSKQILSHVRECCGHGDFLDELLRDISGKHIFRESNTNYIFTLALLLDEKIRGSPIYESLWRCIPIFKKAVEAWLTSPFGSDIHDVLPNCGPMDPDIIVDLLTCVYKLFLFKRLISRTGDIRFQLDIEDLGIVMKMGGELPTAIARMYSITETIMLHEKYIIQLENRIPCFERISHIRPFVVINTEELGRWEAVNTYFVLKGYSSEGSFVFRDHSRSISLKDSLLPNLDEEIFPDDRALSEKTEGNISSGDFRDLMYALCSAGLPMYTHHKHPITFQRKSDPKSARK